MAGTQEETLLQPTPADEAAGEGEEAFVDVVPVIGTNEQEAAVVQSGEGALDDPALPTSHRPPTKHQHQHPDGLQQ